MAFATDDHKITHSLQVGAGWPSVPFLLGPAKIRGSSYIEGPSIFGNANTWGPLPWATVMIGRNTNVDSPPTFAPGSLCFFGGPILNSPYSLAVQGNSGFYGSLDVGLNIMAGNFIVAQGEVISNCGRHVLSLKKDLPFDMPHPNKKGWRLRHVCIEGPEIAVYCRGRVPEDGVIKLPSFWEGLVKPGDLTINITPLGSWQELFVKEITDKQIIVSNNIDGKISADYHIVARRIDDDLIVEYEGESHEDYPNGNEGYSFNFEHNYVENLIKDTVRESVNKKMEENSNGI